MTTCNLSLFLIATAVITGCSDDDDGDVIDDPGVIPGETETVEWHADITGLGQSSAIQGEAQVAYTVGAQSFMAGAEIMFDEPFVDRAWHVHVGNCATGGDIVGPPESYPPLSTDADGTSAVTVIVPARLDPAGQYHVNVHVSAAQLEDIIACGDLVVIGS